MINQVCQHCYTSRVINIITHEIKQADNGYGYPLLDNITYERINQIKIQIESQLPISKDHHPSLVLTDNRDKEFGYLNPQNRNEFRQYDLDGNRYLRSDVLYKSILRDVKKYYTKDFNEATQFITLQSIKDLRCFVPLAASFLRQRFPEFSSQIDPRKWFQSTKDVMNIPDDFIFFFGCLIYPKQMFQIIYSEYNPKKMTKRKRIYSDNFKISQQAEKILKISHESLYKFSLEKLFRLVTTEKYSYLYCSFFQKLAMTKNYIENKNYSKPFYRAYVLAYNALLLVSQKSLISSIYEEGNIEKKRQIFELIQLKQRPMKLFEVQSLKKQQNKQQKYINSFKEIKMLNKRNASLDIWDLEQEIILSSNDTQSYDSSYK
ncbi:UNKNOWN [Stylonychia lemnae]|uniref:Uncharacterized protein n=1 Tax=Stylonychia lemnae TaxID=5949 RepID=A0A078AC36_STYLE|nr:UNKNOWN [Stylonychia lemnae]|eukprot:CDW79396.1 UNKNOWN [Stylonychia lemnae]